MKRANKVLKRIRFDEEIRIHWRHIMREETMQKRAQRQNTGFSKVRALLGRLKKMKV